MMSGWLDLVVVLLLGLAYYGPLLAVVFLLALWVAVRAEFWRTKVTLTGLYLASWLLLFEDFVLVMAAQALLAVLFFVTLFRLGGRW